MSENKSGANNLNTFFLAFVGQYVTITSKLMRTVNEIIEGNIISESVPVFYEGIMLDFDDVWIYLGEKPNEINQAVPIDAVNQIMILEDKTVFDAILEQLPGPEKDEDIN